MRLALACLLAAACSGPPSPSSRCVVDRDEDSVAREVEAELASGGWDGVVVERVRGRHLVRARRGGRVLAGKIEAGAPGCDGVRLDLRELDAPEGADSRFAGPRGPRTSRPPTR